MGESHYGARAKPDRQRDVPLVAGTVVTRRWFQVGWDGHLESPMYGGRWPAFHGEPPWIRATCSQNFGDPWESVVLDERWYQSSNNYWVTRSTHAVGSSHCSCGFYSFFKKPNSSIIDTCQQNAVGAVVENCGRITYGDKGIRSQKLRVLALVLEKEPPASPWNFVKFYTDLLGGLVAFCLLLLIGLVMAGIGWLLNIWLLFGTAVSIFWYGTWGIWLTALIALYLMNAGLPFTWSVAGNKERMTMLREAYPDLPIFDTWKEADKAFPHTKRKDLP